MSWCGRILRRTAGCVLSGCLWLSCLPAGLAEDLAIVIGVNMNQEEGVEDLKYAVADAELMMQTLIEGGFPEKQIVRLSDRPRDGANFPLLEHIRRELRERLPLMQKEDRLILFFAGHGAIKEGEWIFVPYDFRRDDALGTSFRFSELRDLLQQCPAERKLLLLDCCREPMSTGESRGLEPAVLEQEAKLPLSDVFRGSGAAVIAACRAGMRSYEPQELQHGVFAVCLAEALRGAADGVGGGERDGVVDTLELSGWLPTRVRDVARRYKYKQQPIEQQPVVSEDFPTFPLTQAAAESGAVAADAAAAEEPGLESAAAAESGGGYVAMKWLFGVSAVLIVVWFVRGPGRRPRTVRNVGRDRQVVD